MRSVVALFLIGAVAVYAFGAKVVKIVREPNQVAFLLEKGFGVQKDAKNQLTISSAANGKIIKKITTLRGSTAQEDKHYFNRLDNVALPQIQGKIRIEGRIFYCSFAQKYCSVQKIDETL
ncbi:MAG: hypothetical protein LDLANPLL_01379 [Turneriella sp.]|nr:hypothetical protein [Turneriella sp.]